MSPTEDPVAVRAAAWLRGFVPGRMRIDAKERMRACAGAVLGVLITAVGCRALAGPGTAGGWLIASMGASAVLVFVVPASPLAQPWPVVGGNTLSALIGAACAIAVGDAATAGPLAVGLAIAAMLALRCLHPPGSATALYAVLAHEAAWRFAAFPVLANSLLLVAAGLVYNNLTGRRYPHSAAPPTATPPVDAARFTAADLDAALEHYNQVLDVSRDDLEALLHEAETAAYRRTLGALCCADIMSRDVATVEYGTALDDAWRLLRERRVKALPVVDRAGRVAGIVTVADFLRHVNLDVRDGIARRLRAFVRRSGTVHSDKAEAVGQIMTRKVRVVSADRSVTELVPLFSQGSHHHLPVIDDQRRLVGIITQSDLVRALYRAVRIGPG